MLHIKSITKKTLLFSLLLASTIVQAKIIQSDTLACIYDHITQDTVVLCDLDNTILQPTNKECIGSDQWVGKRILQECMSGMSQEEALLTIIKELNYIYPQYNVDTVENKTRQIIETLKAKNIPVFGLTARSKGFAKCTQKNLNQIDISFSKSINNKEINTVDLDDIFPAQYTNGVMFVGSNNKGKITGKFLKYLEYTPKRIIFVDDKIKNVKTVEQYAQENNIDFVGIHLTALAEKIQTYKDKYFILYNNA